VRAVDGLVLLQTDSIVFNRGVAFGICWHGAAGWMSNDASWRHLTLRNNPMEMPLNLLHHLRRYTIRPLCARGRTHESIDGIGMSSDSIGQVANLNADDCWVGVIRKMADASNRCSSSPTLFIRKNPARGRPVGVPQGRHGSVSGWLRHVVPPLTSVHVGAACV